MRCLVLFYTSWVICKERMTMEEIILSLKHYWRFVDSEVLELQALSYRVSGKIAGTQPELIEQKSRSRSTPDPHPVTLGGKAVPVG
jgi:hypothetical protein